MSKAEMVAIYEWQTKPAFLLSVLCPSSHRIEANASDWAEDILQRLPKEIRLFAFHLNLTQTASFPHDRPELCKALSRAGIAVVNSEVTNISKAFIQASCRRLHLPTTEAVPEGCPDEMLIIKTCLNYGGLGERSLDTSAIRILGQGAYGCSIDAGSYKIVKRRDVTHHEWTDPSLFIERFVRNREDRFCRVYVLGAYFVISEVVDPADLKRMPGGIERKNWFYCIHDDRSAALGNESARLMTLADQIRQFVQLLRLDFAALDVVIDDDDLHYIIDVNTTPSWRDTVEPNVETFLHAVMAGMIKGESPVLTF